MSIRIFITAGNISRDLSLVGHPVCNAREAGRKAREQSGALETNRYRIVLGWPRYRGNDN